MRDPTNCDICLTDLANKSVEQENKNDDGGVWIGLDRMNATAPTYAFQWIDDSPQPPKGYINWDPDC